MTGTKKRSSYRKTRKEKGFGGCRRELKNCQETTQNRMEMDQAQSVISTPVREDQASEEDKVISASRKKMKLMAESESSTSSDDELDTENKADGFRLIDIKSLSSALSKVHNCDDEGMFYVFMALHYRMVLETSLVFLTGLNNTNTNQLVNKCINN